MRRILSVLCAFVLGTALIAAPNSDWKAHWISKEHSNSGTNCWMGFRKTVNIGKVPQKVEARIAADTKYWLWINGEMAVFEGGLKRGRTPMSTYYDVVDIAPYLKEGENVIAAAVWHFGRTGFSHIDSGITGFIFEATGEGVEIISDGSWDCTVLKNYGTADTPSQNYRLPESNVRFDARAYPVDWYKGSDYSFMGRCIELPFAPGDAPFGEMVERPIPMWKDYGVKEYVSVERRGDTLACRLPYNCQVSPRLRVNAPPGCVITIMTDHANVGGTQCLTGQYVTSNGVQEYEHLPWLNGEWVYYIIPKVVNVMGVSYRETGYGCELSGSFKCDDELLNEYWQKAQRTLYVCMRDTYYDCPDRERAQWIGDEVNELAMASYMLSPSSSALALKGILEVYGWQKPDGSLYGPVPCSNWFRELPMQSLAFIGWYGAWRYAYDSGDFSFVGDIAAGMHKYLHETWQLDADGMPVYREGGWDWPDAGENRDRYAQLPLWYYLALKAEKEFAEYLGREDVAAADEALMNTIAARFNELYWTGSEYRSAAHEGPADDRVQALAVVSGIAPADHYPAITEILKTSRYATTYMHRHVLDAFCLMGHPELAQELMHFRYPCIMKDKCSTLWEHWNYEGSCNHAWSGCGVITMCERFAGITPLEPGFKTFKLEPQMGNLKHIEMQFETRYGVISVILDKKGRTLKASFTVPEGCTAVVPCSKDSTYGPGTHSCSIVGGL